MDITGRQTLWRLRGAAALNCDSITWRGQGLEPLVDLPFAADGDKAEALAPWYPATGAMAGDGHAGVLVVYDAPVAARKIGEDGVRADVFALPSAGGGIRRA